MIDMEVAYKYKAPWKYKWYYSCLLSLVSYGNMSPQGGGEIVATSGTCPEGRAVELEGGGASRAVGSPPLSGIKVLAWSLIYWMNSDPTFLSLSCFICK